MQPAYLRSWIAAAALAAALGSAPVARAQSAGVVVPGGDRCQPLDDSCGDDDDCAGAFPGRISTCESFHLRSQERRQCRPRVSIFCCTDSVECPDGSTCGAMIAGASACLFDEDDYCEDAPSVTRISACHTDLDGTTRPVPYDLGDCDGDGVRNGVERAVDTDPCTAPPARLAVWTRATGGAACVPGVHACSTPGTECRIDNVSGARCVSNDATGDAAPLCSLDPDVFCCGGLATVQCPDPDQACIVPDGVDDAFGFCGDRDGVCATTAAGLRACFTAPDGTYPVGLHEGDCDGDGAKNAEEDRAGRDRCVADDEPADTDAGDGAEPDAGVSEDFDAGSALDNLAPRFGGGGGCVCRAALGGRAGGWALAALAVVALVLRRRARR